MKLWVKHCCAAFALAGSSVTQAAQEKAEQEPERPYQLLAYERGFFLASSGSTTTRDRVPSFLFWKAGGISFR